MVICTLYACMHAHTDPEDPYKLTDKTRNLGLTVIRGPSVMLICPEDGTEEIANPFNQQEQAAI